MEKEGFILSWFNRDYNKVDMELGFFLKEKNGKISIIYLENPFLIKNYLIKSNNNIEDIKPIVDTLANNIGIDYYNVDLGKTTKGYQKDPKKILANFFCRTNKQAKKLDELLIKGVKQTINDSIIGFIGENISKNISSYHYLSCLGNFRTYGYVKVMCKPKNSKNTKAPEYVCNLENIKKWEEGHNVEEDFYIVSIDTENYTPNGFKNIEDPTHHPFLISVVSQYALQNDTRTKKIFSIYNFNQDLIFKDIEVIFCYDVKDMIIKFWDYLAELPMNVITTWNGHGFDFKTIFAEMKKYNIKYPIKLSYSKDKVTNATEKVNNQDQYYTDIKYPVIPGVMVLDLFRIFKQDEPNKTSYSLMEVSREVLGETKLDVTQKIMMKNVLQIKEWENTHNADGRIKNIKEQPSQNEMSSIINYCVVDSELVLKMMTGNFMRLLLWQSEILNSPIEYFYNKGVSNLVSNLYNREACKNNMFPEHMNVENTNVLGGKNTEMEKVIENVVQIDITSLYPTIIQKYNIGNNTKILKENLELYDKSEYNTYVIEPDMREVYLVKKDIEESLISKVIEKLKPVRLSIKEQSLNTENNYEARRLDSLQKNIKKIMSSFYGILGQKEGYSSLTDRELAALITTEGRKTYDNIIKIVSKYGNIVQGDTDGVSFSPLKGGEFDNPKKLFDLGKIVRKEIKDALDMESVFQTGKILVIKRKQYMFWPFTPDGNFMPESKIKYVNITACKSTSCKYICELWKKISFAIINGHPYSYSLDILLDSIKDLLNNEIKIEDLIIKRSGITKILVSESEKITDVDGVSKITPGYLSQYLFAKVKINNKNKITKKSEKVTPDFYEETIEIKDAIEIDVKTYLKEKMKDIIDDLFETGYNNAIEVANSKYMTKDDFIKPMEKIMDIFNSQKSIEETLNKITDFKNNDFIKDGYLIKTV